MQLRFFRIPAGDTGCFAEELNAFLRGHRILTVQREFVTGSDGAWWAICVEYLSAASAGTGPAANGTGKGKIDYREKLSAEDFVVFSALRDIRKELAERDGVPVYAVFTNEPTFEKRLIFDCYACRTGKGRIKALARAQHFARRHPWFLKLDVRRYFDSIDHAAMTSLLERILKDEAVLGIFRRIIGSHCVKPGKGLPIGNLTSQHFANLYLGELDHLRRNNIGFRPVRSSEETPQRAQDSDPAAIPSATPRAVRQTKNARPVPVIAAEAAANAPGGSVWRANSDRETGILPVMEDSASRLSAHETTGWKPVVGCPQLGQTRGLR